MDEVLTIMIEEFGKVSDTSSWQKKSQAADIARKRVISYFVNLPKAQVKRIISDKIWNHVPMQSYYYNANNTKSLKTAYNSTTKYTRKYAMGFVAEAVTHKAQNIYPKLYEFIGKNGVGVWQFIYLHNAYPEQKFPRTSSNTKKFNNLMVNAKDGRVKRIALANASISAVREYSKDIEAGNKSCSSDIKWRVLDRLRKETQSDASIELLKDISNCKFDTKSNHSNWDIRRQLRYAIPQTSSKIVKKYLSLFLTNGKTEFEDEQWLSKIKGGSWEWSLYREFLTLSLQRLDKDDLLFFIDAFPNDLQEDMTNRMESKWG